MSKEILSRALELAKQGIPDEGINLLRPLLMQPEFQKDAIYLMAFCYEQKRDHATAIHLYGQLVKLDPVNAAPSERLKICHAALSQSVATAESQTGWGKRCTILLPLLVVLGGVALGMAIATPELLYYGEAVLPSMIGGGFLLFIAFLLLLGGIRRVFIRASSIRQARGTDYTNQRQRTCWACGLSVPEKGGRCLFCQADKKQRALDSSVPPSPVETHAPETAGTVSQQTPIPPESSKPIPTPIAASEFLGILLLVIPVGAALLGWLAGNPGVSFLLAILVTLATAILIAIEAYLVGAGKQTDLNAKGKKREGPLALFFATLLLWLVVFPFWMYRRSVYGRKNLCILSLFACVVFFFHPMLSFTNNVKNTPEKQILNSTIPVKTPTIPAKNEITKAEKCIFLFANLPEIPSRSEMDQLKAAIEEFGQESEHKIEQNDTKWIEANYLYLKNKNLNKSGALPNLFEMYAVSVVLAYSDLQQKR